MEINLFLKKDFPPLARKEGRPSLVDDKILQKIRYFTTESRLAGTPIYQKRLSRL